MKLTVPQPALWSLYDLCDEMGFVVMDEAFDEWEGCKNKWWQGHNVYPNDPYVHPLFLEMTGNNDSNKPEAERQFNKDKPNMERLASLAAELAGIVKKHDATRPVVLAAAFPELSSKLGFFDSLDVAGYNYKEQFYEEDHKRFPKLPILGSENLTATVPGIQSAVFSV